MKKWGVLLLAAMLLTALALGAGAEEFFAEESFGGEESFVGESFFEEEFFAEEPGEDVTEEALPEEAAADLEDRSMILFEKETVSGDAEDAAWAKIQPKITATVKNKKISLEWTFKDSTGADVKLPKGVKFYIYRVEREWGYGWTDQAKTTTGKKYSYTAKKPGDYTFYVRAEYVKKGVERYGKLGKVKVNVASTGEWKKIKKMTPTAEGSISGEQYNEKTGKNEPVYHFYSDFGVTMTEAPDAFEVRVTVKPKGAKQEIKVDPIVYVPQENELENLSVGKILWIGYTELKNAPELEAGMKVTYFVRPVKLNKSGKPTEYGTEKKASITIKAPKASGSSWSWKNAPSYVHVEQFEPLKIRVLWDHSGADYYLIYGIGKTPIQYTPEDDWDHSIEIDVPKTGKYSISVQPVGTEINKKGEQVEVKGKKSKAAKVNVVDASQLMVAVLTYSKDWANHAIEINWNSYADSIDRFEVFITDAKHQKELYKKIKYNPKKHEYSVTFDISGFTTERGNFAVKAIGKGEVLTTRNVWGIYFN